MTTLSEKRHRLCSVENANRVAVMVSDITGSDTVVVRTANPIQPHRVLIANCADDAAVVTRVTR